jgi:hypothetical protein
MGASLVASVDASAVASSFVMPRSISASLPAVPAAPPLASRSEPAPPPVVAVVGSPDVLETDDPVVLEVAPPRPPCPPTPVVAVVGGW